MRDKTRALLSTLLRYAVQKGRVDTNPAQKARETLTREERREREGSGDRIERMPSTDGVTKLVAHIPIGTARCCS